MSPPRVLTALLLMVAATLAMWWLWPPSPVSEPNPPNQSRAAGTERATRDAAGAGARQHRQPAIVPATAASQTQLQLRLRGMHPEMPWRGAMQLEFEDRDRRRTHEDHRTTAEVDAQGRCVLTLPSWWRRGRSVKLVIKGTSPGYRPLIHRDEGQLQLTEQLVIDVQPLAELRGVIRNSRGNPIATARIAAFASRAGQPYGDAVGQTGSADDGSYHLFAPPDTPLLITVTAMQPNRVRFRREDGVNDSGQARADLQPTGRIVHLAANRPGVDCHFTLADAAVVTCALRWPDGTPAASCLVRTTPADALAGAGTPLRLSHACTLRWHTNGTFATETTTLSDPRGQLRIGTKSGQQTDVQIIQVPTVRILGELPKQRVVAPGELAITLPAPVVLRAVHLGELQPHARILTRGKPPHRAGPDGMSIVLASEEFESCADFGPLRSPWARVRSGPTSQQVDLIMANTLAPLDLRFADGAKVGAATISWQRDDGRSGTEYRMVPEGRQAVRLWLEPGTYALRVSGGHPGNEGFLLPIERNVTVAGTTSLSLPAKFGGTFSLVALDDKGQALAGKCVVRTPKGQEQLVHLASSGEPGSFAAEATRCSDNLEPGPYELIIDLGSRGVHRRYVNITEGHTTPVVLRL